MSDNQRPRKTLEQRLLESSELLESIVADRGILVGVDDALRERFLIAAGRVSRPNKRQRKALARARQRVGRSERKRADQELLDQTGIRKLRLSPIFETPRRIAQHAGKVTDGLTGKGADAAGSDQSRSEMSPSIGRVGEERICYCCRAKYCEVHHFYDQLCISCGDLNYAKRSQIADLNGRVALVTGARVKIGYQAAIFLLRAGCRVICTTRFPRDAARRYAAESDFGEWGDRLEIYGVDLRHTPSVEGVCQSLLGTHDRLDFIVNNACQTVRRPPAFYEHLMAAEVALESDLNAVERALLPADASPRHVSTEAIDGSGRLSSAHLSQVELLREDAERGEHLFPSGLLDADLQQVDLRKVNSWRLKLADVSTIEVLEVHLVNAVAPFLFNARLKPLMTAVPSADKHIVNVSAMEGQFYRIFKTDRHPHTNMAKASLNMMTRTSAVDYYSDGIHMNSVDTGWVTDEDPIDHADMKREVHSFHPPLDIVDGAARIVDPIFTGINTGRHVWGQFLKDYRETDW